MPCPFCKMDRHQIKSRNTTVYAIEDTAPVTRHHLLIIPFRHCETYFEMTRKERCDAHDMIVSLRRQILTEDDTVTGFNIGINCGGDAGQTIFHAHIHLIPRRNRDTPSPRGGVRGVVPDKMDY
ncbi:MAG: HIT family protein [Proteobacteria bacterium]|nr:HIT family protein [Pseudomonadota bacterium]